MASWVVVLLFSVGAVLLFVVGLSLTLMVKGRHIDSEIATNKHMQARGITCAAHDARRESRRKTVPGTLSDGDSASGCADSICDDHNCGSCTK